MKIKSEIIYKSLVDLDSSTNCGEWDRKQKPLAKKKEIIHNIYLYT